MKKISLILLPLVLLIACSKGSQIEPNSNNSLKSIMNENAYIIGALSDLLTTVDVEIISQYTYSSISNEYKSFNSTATFENDDLNAEVEINGFKLIKNEQFPSQHRHVGQFYEQFSALFKDKSGMNIPIKVSNSAVVNEFSSSTYIPKAEKSDIQLVNNNLELKWNVDQNIQNNVMLVNLRFSDGSISNLKLNYNTGSALVDLNTLEGAPAVFEDIMIEYIYGTAKIVETSTNKKVRILTLVSNRSVVYKNRE